MSLWKPKEPVPAEYPEHDKLRAVKVESQAVGEFLEWMKGQGLFVATWMEGDIEDVAHPVSESAEGLIARHFGIDTAKLEQEKREMLESIRDQRKARS